MPIIRAIKMSEGETLEVQWYLKDGTSTHTERYTVPPRPTRDARSIAVTHLDLPAPPASPAPAATTGKSPKLIV